MARRATVLEGYRREPVPTLTLVGADEFSPDTELPDPAKTGDASPEAVRAVYDALHVDCGMLSAGAAAWFGASRPRNFFEVGDTPVTKRFHVGGVPVAVILFPPLSAGGTPFAGEVNAQAPGLIWSRADKDGRSVMAIDIMALPEPGVPFAWEWGLSMQAQEVRLTSAVPSNPHMEALVAGKAAR